MIIHWYHNQLFKWILIRINQWLFMNRGRWAAAYDLLAGFYVPLADPIIHMNINENKSMNIHKQRSMPDLLAGFNVHLADLVSTFFKVKTWLNCQVKCPTESHKIRLCTVNDDHLLFAYNQSVNQSIKSFHQSICHHLNQITLSINLPVAANQGHSVPPVHQSNL